MKKVIIVHGMPSKESYEASGRIAGAKHWMPWLVSELAKAGIEAHHPEMPEPYAPDYEKWSQVFELFNIDENTMLVGHSAGGGFLVRWLSEHKDKKVGKVVLVAPWIDPTHAWAPAMFNELVIDENLAERTAGVTEFISLDDEQDELDTLAILKEKIKRLEVIEFKDKGHFISAHMGTDEFPELRDYLLS